MPTTPWYSCDPCRVASTRSGAHACRRQNVAAKGFLTPPPIQITLPPMLQARAQCAAAFMGGRLCFVGGLDGFGVLDSVECFDPATHSWVTLPPLATSRAHAGAAVARMLEQPWESRDVSCNRLDAGESSGSSWDRHRSREASRCQFEVHQPVFNILRPNLNALTHRGASRSRGVGSGGCRRRCGRHAARNRVVAKPCCGVGS